jgi:hypothetical protein
MLEAGYQLNDLFHAKVTLTDSMNANFNKDLAELLKEVFKFASQATYDVDYEMQPEDSTLNIANPINYLPSEDDFNFGTRVFTNPSSNSNDLMSSTSDFPLALRFMQWAKQDKWYYFETY